MKMFSSGRPHLAAPTAAETADQNYVKHIFGKIMMKNNFENIVMKKFLSDPSLIIDYPCH